MHFNEHGFPEYLCFGIMWNEVWSSSNLTYSLSLSSAMLGNVRDREQKSIQFETGQLS